jgi:uncharacterized protein YggE
MTQATITVRGEHTARHQPERATAHATVHHEGPEREPVLSAAMTSADAVRAAIEPLFDADAGPVTRWSSESVRVWAQRPWNQDGAQLPPVHHAEVGFTAEFSDFSALARWVEDAARINGAVIHQVTWELTEATRATVTAQARTRAIADAVEKASAYAAAVGLPAPVPVALADPGMLGDRPAGDGGGMMPAMAMRATKFDSTGGAPELALRPEELTVSCTVDARFLAG